MITRRTIKIIQQLSYYLRIYEKFEYCLKLKRISIFQNIHNKVFVEIGHFKLIIDVIIIDRKQKRVYFRFG